MRALVKEATPFLAQRARKNEKKAVLDERDNVMYVFFLDMKKKA